MTTERRAKGHIPDGEHASAVEPFRLTGSARAGVPLPDEVDLTPFVPTVLDQTNTNSCVGHALAIAIFVTFARAGQPLAFMPSPLHGYQLARAMERSVPSVPLRDSGCRPSLGVRSLNEWGIRPMRAPSPLGFNSDCDLSNVNDEPVFEDLETSATRILVGQYGIVSSGAQCVSDICAALNAGYGTVLSSFVDLAFERLHPGSDVYDLPDRSDAGGGLHYLTVVGFRTVSARKQFLLQSSWGALWANGGRAWVTERFVTQSIDRYALSVRMAA